MQETQARAGPPSSFWDNSGRLWASQLPYTLLKRPNPLFTFQMRVLDRRGIRLPQDRVAKYATNWGCLIPAALAAVTALLFLSNAGGGLLFLALGLGGLVGTFGLSVFCDLYYVVVTINLLKPGTRAIDWDLVRITLITEQEIIAAHYAVAQLRAWRTMIAEMGLRLFIVMASLLSYFGISLTYSRQSYSEFDGSALVWPIVFSAILSVVYVLEPLWRMRALTALGLNVGMRISSVTLAYLTAFLAILGMLLTQGLLVLGLYMGSIIIILGTDERYFSELAVALALIVSAAVLYLFFRLIRVISFRGAVRSLRRSQ